MTQPNQMHDMMSLWASSHIAGANASYIEDLFEDYLKDPNGVPPEWRDYFDRLPKVQTSSVSLHDVPHSVLREQFAKISKLDFSAVGGP